MILVTQRSYEVGTISHESPMNILVMARLFQNAVPIDPGLRSSPWCARDSLGRHIATACGR